MEKFAHYQLGGEGEWSSGLQVITSEVGKLAKHVVRWSVTSETSSVTIYLSHVSVSFTDGDL